MLQHLCALIISAAPPPALDALLGEPHGETRAIVVVHKGEIIAERYAPGYDAGTRLISWSIAKSVTHALLGVAVAKKRVDIDEPMGSPHWSKDDPRSKITWRQWIQMVDGQQFAELAKSQVDSSTAMMLFGPGRLDVAAYAAALPLIHTPGTHWNYNSGGINLITDQLTNIIAPNASAPERRARMLAFMRDELFLPAGMPSAVPEFDATGTFVGSAFVYATARDFARFGQLYLHDGVVDGKRILPEGWADFARTRGPGKNTEVYGAGFWVTPGTDLYRAQGHEGQLIVISPSKDLVFVRLGRTVGKEGLALIEWMKRVAGLF